MPGTSFGCGQGCGVNAEQLLSFFAGIFDDFWYELAIAFVPAQQVVVYMLMSYSSIVALSVLNFV
jgi:hypothetical protein